MNRSLGTAVLLLLSALAAAPAAAAEGMPVPVKLQAALFQKIFGYDKALGSAAAARIGVVYADAAPSTRDEVVRVFTEAGLAATPVKLSAVASPGNVNVLYLLPGTDSAAVQQACRAGKLLSISGVPAFADTGFAAIALESVGDKPKIVVNLGALKAAEHQLSPDLLRLARVVQ